MTAFLKKKLPIIMAVAAILCVVGAVLIFLFPVANADAPYKMVLGIIIGAILIVFALLIALYLWLERDTEPNFFLFDRKRKRNISPDELTFKLVNERLILLMTTVSRDMDELWNGGVLDNELKLGFRKIYRPLIAYKMLYDLADKNVDDYWSYLLNCTPETVRSITVALRQAGETKMADTFQLMMSDYRDTPVHIRNFISGNMKYIRSRTMAYIKNNIEMFY